MRIFRVVPGKTCGNEGWAARVRDSGTVWFYKTPAWRRARDAYIKKREAIDGGLCEVCHSDRGRIVHHIIWLTSKNVYDEDISLNEKNFRYECQTCHNREKDPADEYGVPRFFFDDEGNVILPPSDEK